MPGVGGTVLAATTWDPDGTGPASPRLVIGGTFGSAGTVLASNIASWDGNTWEAVGGGLTGDVYAITEYNGELIAGGRITLAGTTPVNKIAAFSPITGQWRSLGTGLTDAPFETVQVSALKVYNGELYVAGAFTLAGGAPATGIARWSAAANSGLGGWLSTGGGLANNGSRAVARALAIYDGELVIGGDFTEGGGVSSGGIIRWSPLNGGTWGAFSSGLSGIKAITVFNAQLHVGGTFPSVAGGSSSIAKWNGSAWQGVGSGSFVSVNCLTTFNSELVAGGTFLQGLGLAPSTGVARWNGTSWAGFTPTGLGFQGTSGWAYAFTVFQGTLVVGGQFDRAGGLYTQGIAQWNGAVWSVPCTGLNGTVLAMVPYNDSLVFAGAFGHAGAVDANNIVRWSGRQGAWQAFGSGLTKPQTPAAVFAITTYAGDLIAGGDFTQAGGSNAAFIARWSDATGQWRTLGSGFNGVVNCLGNFNGELIAGGSFSLAGSISALNIAAWSDSSQSWRAFGNGVNGSVSAVTVHNGSLVIANANFSANRVARWDGSAWQPFGSGPSMVVNTLAVFRGELIAAGSSSSGVNRVARWNGISWQQLGAGLNNNVRALWVHQDRLFAGGVFTTSGSVPVSRIARWDGSSWSGLDGGLVVLDSLAGVRTLSTFQGELLVGGNFAAVGQKMSAGWARWGCQCPADFNGDEILGVQDIFDYLAAWFEDNPAADLNGGGLSVQDVFDFLASWFEGC